MNQKKIRFSNFGFILWLTSACFTALIVAFILGAGMFRHISGRNNQLPESISKLVIVLAMTPSLIKQATLEMISYFNNEPTPLLINKDKVKDLNLEHKFPAPQDSGYLLLSGLSAQKKQSTVQLIRIADGNIIAEWVPDWNIIHSKLSAHRWFPKVDIKSYRAIHPLLLNDGSLIFNTGSSLIRLPLCSPEPNWVLNYPYHHSIELAPDGESVWTASITEKFFSTHPTVKEKLLDNSLSNVDLRGQVLQNLSFSEILVKNGFIAHLIGTNGTAFNNDPIHINQISPAKSDGSYWKLGDLLISARHLSTVYLYRPSTGKIIWHQQGPWINQHSAHFVGNQTIAVFGNDVYSSDIPDPFITPAKRNSVYLHDFKTATTRQVHSEPLDKLQPKTITEGRVRVLYDMGTFIEETNNARLIKLDPNGRLQWSYINNYDEKHLGIVSWSRYITSAELESTLVLSTLKCEGNPPLLQGAQK